VGSIAKHNGRTKLQSVACHSPAYNNMQTDHSHVHYNRTCTARTTAVRPRRLRLYVCETHHASARLVLSCRFQQPRLLVHRTGRKSLRRLQRCAPRLTCSLILQEGCAACSLSSGRERPIFGNFLPARNHLTHCDISFAVVRPIEENAVSNHLGASARSDYSVIPAVTDFSGVNDALLDPRGLVPTTRCTSHNRRLR
jgi:hypothetical protein